MVALPSWRRHGVRRAEGRATDDAPTAQQPSGGTDGERAEAAKR